MRAGAWVRGWVGRGGEGGDGTRAPRANSSVATSVAKAPAARPEAGPDRFDGGLRGGGSGAVPARRGRKRGRQREAGVCGWSGGWVSGRTGRDGVGWTWARGDGELMLGGKDEWAVPHVFLVHEDADVGEALVRRACRDPLVN